MPSLAHPETFSLLFAIHKTQRKNPLPLHLRPLKKLTKKDDLLDLIPSLVSRFSNLTAPVLTVPQDFKKPDDALFWISS